MELKSKILKVVILLLLSASRIYAFDNLPTIYSLITSDELSVSESQKPENPVFSDLIKEEQNEEDAHFDLPFSGGPSYSFQSAISLTDHIVPVIRRNPFVHDKLFIFFSNLRI